MKTSVKTNIIANYAGKAVAVLIALFFVPVYIRYLGMEAYGLIGFYLVLQTLFGIFDLGFSQTLNRELARLSTRADAAQQARDLVRTLETIYWAIGLLIGIVIVAAAGPIAERWVNIETLSDRTARSTLVLIGIVIALQWPFSFYEGGMIGLQRMVVYNGLQSVQLIVRAVGAVAVLHFIAPTVFAFFVWQAVVSAASTASAAVVLWRSLPAGAPPRFSVALLRTVWRFAGAITLISVVSLALTQSDKIVLSKNLTLTDFGYYNLAALVASVLYYLSFPIYGAILPRLSQQVAIGDTAAISRTYHAGCQLMTVITGPAALMLIAFAPEIMLLWTGDAVTVQATALLVRLLTLGALLTAMLTVPFALTLSHGWTSLTLYINSIALIVQVPVLLFAVQRFGAAGAAVVMVSVNAIGFFGSVNIMHTRLLRTERWRWYLHDVAAPLVMSAAVIGLARLVLPPLPAVVLLFVLIGIGVAALAAAAAVAPVSRAALVDLFSRLPHRPTLGGGDR